MCRGFDAIVSNELNVYFCEPDTDGDVSHSEILGRLEWKDNTDQHLRRFVRVECADWTMGSFGYDESGSLPGWAEEHDAELRGKVSAVLDKTAPAWAEYEKACDAAWAEYQKVSAPAWAGYVKVRDAALAECQKVCDAAWAEYLKVCDAARAEYVKVRAPAWAEMIGVMSKVAGYVAAKEQTDV